MRRPGDHASTTTVSVTFAKHSHVPLGKEEHVCDKSIKQERKGVQATERD